MVRKFTKPTASGSQSSMSPGNGQGVTQMSEPGKIPRASQIAGSLNTSVTW